jgi:hypothetical protein
MIFSLFALDRVFALGGFVGFSWEYSSVGRASRSQLVLSKIAILSYLLLHAQKRMNKACAGNSRFSYLLPKMPILATPGYKFGLQNSPLGPKSFKGRLPEFPDQLRVFRGI